MVEKSDNALTRVLARWGLGSEALGVIDAGEEQEILRCLGAAVIKGWADLPRDVQRSLFEAAAGAGKPEREDIALFLHMHHRDTARSGAGTTPAP
ncbi:MAG: hypothetical protein JWL62_1264 [Hyphomicrobiales bacterium]|nr:hypothetical protein [Hyphomicrobiales bacterium]